MGWFGLGSPMLANQIDRKLPAGVQQPDAGLFSVMSSGPRGGPNGMTPGLFEKLQGAGVLPSPGQRGVGGTTANLSPAASGYLQQLGWSGENVNQGYGHNDVPTSFMSGLSPNEIDTLSNLIKPFNPKDRMGRRGPRG